MEGSHYFLKTLGLESYISPDPLPRVDMDNFELDSKMKVTKSGDCIKDGICDKQDVIGDEVGQITDSVQADDFFSSLELQSSSKTSSNVISLNFSSKATGGIVTRSRSFSSTLHETCKTPDKIVSKSRKKGRPKKDMKKKRTEKIRLKRKIKTKSRKLDKKLSSDGKILPVDSKKQISKLDENILEKSLGVEKARDDDDWVIFNNLNTKKEMEDKMFENKQILSNDLQNSVRRCTPELFSMNSILMNDDISEGKDEVDNLLEVEDYDDCFLEEIEEFNCAPPRSHTGGKWKPGTLTIRTSPMLWQNQNWDFLDDRNQDEERRNRDTPTSSPTESLNKYSAGSGKWKSFAPPAGYTGGKWKPAAPPAGHTGGKWRPNTPPATHTGGKWKPSEFGHRRREMTSPVESDNWKYESEKEVEPPPSHTGGKWKPSHAAELWKTESSSKIPSSHTSGKWVAGSGKSTVNRSTLDVLANCQSTSGKCLKTSGGMIQYYCSPCNRRLSSKKMYKKHVQSELHFKRVLQENELEFDSRSLKLFHGLFTQGGYRERGLGKREIKKPEMFNDSEMQSFKKEKKILTLVKIKGKRVTRREIIRCDVCKVKVPSYQLGKHLVSYYHSRRIRLNDPEQQKLILDNIHAIVKQAPYQCGICKFYCNTHTSFKKHWALPVHKEVEQSNNQRFWCVLCSFECETSRSMELHLDSNSHREVILAVNKSIPIIIRHKVLFNCNICFKEFRFNRELIRHKKIFHEMDVKKSDKFVCPICQQNCKNIKAFQRHVINSHKGDTKVPYFCSTCNEFFNTAAEAKTHRNSQPHKYKKLEIEGETSEKLILSKSCLYCNKTFEDLANLKTHLLESHSGFLPKCMKCGMVFPLSQELSQHTKSNECVFGGEKPSQFSPHRLFTCETCTFTTNTKSEFLLHTAIHEKKSKVEKKISCPLCGALFTQTSLGIHLRTHLKERTYQCAVCSKAFVRKDRYVSHLKLKHGTKECFEFEEAEKKKEKSEEDENKMEETGELNNANVQMEKKCEKKTTERRQICGDSKCKYVAKDLTDLENHSLFHIGPKVYQCPECPYSAKTNAIIKRHYLIHADERSFPCHLCSFKARLKSHLKRHMRLHTGAKPYKCPHCSYTCNILENLRKHVLYTKIHPGKKLYECKLCNFSTNVSKDFKMHLFKSHKDNCRLADSNEVAGIYNREEDCKNTVSNIKVKPRVTAKPAKKVYPAAFKKKVDLLTQKFSPIAPKPPCDKELTNVKITGNSVEDKRKILKMELEKLKNQIKPTGKMLPRSYPHPAETGPKMASVEAEKKCPMVKKTPKDPAENILGQSDVFLVNMIPAMISVSEEPLPKAIKSEEAQQQMELSPACVLYENVLPTENMELYLLEDYQV